MIPVSIAWFARKDENLTIPKMVTGGQVSTESDDQSKKKKEEILLLGFIRFGNCVFDSHNYWCFFHWERLGLSSLVPTME